MRLLFYCRSVVVSGRLRGRNIQEYSAEPWIIARLVITKYLPGRDQEAGSAEVASQQVSIMGNDRGFSLIELLIVVAVIAIIAAVTVPNLTKAKASANEGSAITSVRAIVTAQSTFIATVGSGSYAANLAALQTAGLIDRALGSGSKDGYNFASTGSGATFTVTASPITHDVSGNRGFFADETGVIRFDASGTATASSTPLGGTPGS